MVSAGSAAKPADALGMGATPIAGQLLVSRGASYQDVFAVGALLDLGAAALFALLARVMPAHAATARADGAARSRIGPARLVLASGRTAYRSVRVLPIPSLGSGTKG